MREQQLKYGFDVHGVLDTYPAFCEMTHALVEAGHEVYIITGLKEDEKSAKLLKDLDVVYHHTYYSIVDDLESQGVEIEWRDGLPYADKTKWEEAKALFCQREGIDIIFDDSVRYRDKFDELGVSTLFNLVHNKQRIEYQTRG